MNEWNKYQRCFITSRKLQDGATTCSSSLQYCLVAVWSEHCWEPFCIFSRFLRVISVSALKLYALPEWVSGDWLSLTCRMDLTMGSYQPQPSWAGCSCRGNLLSGFQNDLLQEKVHWCCWETVAADFHGEYNCVSSFDKSLIDQVLVLGFLKLVRGG